MLCTDPEHTCWNAHLPRRNNAAQYHTVVNPLFQLFVGAVTHSEANSERQNQMHHRDEQARWFNMKRDHTLDRPDLFVYDRYTQLCDPSRSGNTATRTHYPSFVSFVGDTSVGKSTLVRAMLLMGIVKRSRLQADDHAGQLEALANVVDNQAHDVPVTRSANINHLTDPTTLGVHLYRDHGVVPHHHSSDRTKQEASSSQFPILFADCEGFKAGEAMTNAERSERMEVEVADGRGRGTTTTRSRSASRHRDALQLGVTANCYSTHGKDGVDLFYARFLYAISDVIVFVTKDDQKIQSELTRVLEWASKAVHKSVNHPSRKTLIIVRNMAMFHDETFYRPDRLKDLYLSNHPPLWKDSPILKEFVEEYNEKRYDDQIEDNEKLYGLLFNNIVCCYIPNKDKVKGKPQELFNQYEVLRDAIESSVRAGLKLRAESFMQYNVPRLSHILNQAFKHFTSSEKPFDFFLAARKDNPNPQSVKEHVANFLRHAYESSHRNEEVERLVFHAMSTALLIFAHRNLDAAPPVDIFDRELYEICNQGVDIYVKEYEKCMFRFPDGQSCTSRPAKLHYRHTVAAGTTFVPGMFEHRKHWLSSKREWIRSIRRKFIEVYQDIFRPKEGRDATISPEKRLVEMRKRSRASYQHVWRCIKSNKTCLSCLQSVPDHVLGCGHSYCPRCVQELGDVSGKSECAWDMSCWLCFEDAGQEVHTVQLRPRCAGARILTLDGGGVRGIVELMVLDALKTKIGLDSVPIKDMFDLIVGTSTGGIIALALGMSKESNSIPDMMSFFRKASTTTFSKTNAGWLSQFAPIKKLATYSLMFFRVVDSMYPSEELIKAVKTFFGETSLFAPALSRLPQATRVAVTSAKDMGDTECLITSYNHPEPNPHAIFEREEDTKKDMKVWEAALATSAAPPYLAAFEKEETRTTYVDGAVYANCPAQVALTEVENLWPHNGAQLDTLLSLGTGVQGLKDRKIPSIVNFGFFRAVRGMIQRQLDSKSTWETFSRQHAPANIRSRLRRFDPPLKGEYVDIYDCAKIPDLIDDATIWVEGTGKSLLEEMANTLIANLFFFEPDGEDAVHVETPLLMPSDVYESLPGSIRCRIAYENPDLKRLLGKVVQGFYYAEVESNDIDEVTRFQNWKPIQPKDTLPIDMMIAETGYNGRSIKKFRLPYRLTVKKPSHAYQTLGVKLHRSDSIMAISGFPCKLSDLQKRSKMRWLQ